MARDEAAGGRVELFGLTKSYIRRDGTQVTAVDNVTLTIEPGEFLVLLGPSGCGKTTLLRSIAGLETVQAGQIFVHGRKVVDVADRLFVPPENRNVSMMFQSYALWPHMSVLENVAFPLKSRGVGRAERQERAERVMAAVGITELAGSFPSQISGGQQQRVALARALIADDGIVLFDEPLSNVDAKVREHLRSEILSLHHEFKFTAVYVTHDQDEALTLASRLIVLREGKVAQDAPPREVYVHPSNSYVARFMGAANEFTGDVESVEDARVIVSGPLGQMYATSRSVDVSAGQSVSLFSRPERWLLLRDQPPAGGLNTWPAKLLHTAFRGFYVDQDFQVGEQTVRVRSVAGHEDALGSDAWLRVAPEDMHIAADA